MNTLLPRLLLLAALALGLATNSPAAEIQPPDEQSRRAVQAALIEARAEFEKLQVQLAGSDPAVTGQLAKIAALEKQLRTAPVADADAHLISIDFPGGPLDQLMVVLAKTNTGGFNLLSEDPKMLATIVPPFSVHNVTPTAFAAALNLFFAPRSLVVEKIIPDQFYGGQDHPGPDVYVMRAAKSSTAAPGRFLAFQLAPYLEQQSIDDIVGAVRAAWELDPTHKPDELHVKFHPPTSILLVSGPSDALNISQQVIQSLKRGSTAPRVPAPTPTPSPGPDKM
jgi:hypothetical protein